jgi:hypothetical protein
LRPWASPSRESTDALPITVGNVAVGTSTTVNLVLTVPPTVTNLAIIEAGSMQDSQAKTYGFTLGEEVVP